MLFSNADSLIDDFYTCVCRPTAVFDCFGALHYAGSICALITSLNDWLLTDSNSSRWFLSVFASAERIQIGRALLRSEPAMMVIISISPSISFDQHRLPARPSVRIFDEHPLCDYVIKLYER